MALASLLRRAKTPAARVLSATGTSAGLAAAQRLALRTRFIRAVNYHGTPSKDAASFERQLAWYARHYAPVSHDDLAGLFEAGEWRASRPGLIISFDDGHRSNYDVARPLLERYGFVGWFFVPSQFLSPGGPDRERVAQYRIVPDEHYADGRTMMSEAECRELASTHVVGCHTRTHQRLGAGVPDATLHEEVVLAKAELERIVGRAVDTFCWVGGEEASYSQRAARVIREAGYRFSFMTNSAPITARTEPLQLQRTNIEAGWPLDLAAFQLSGIVDLVYHRKRNRVNHLTRA